MTSYVITASVYVDDVDTPEEATEAVELLNNYIQEISPNDNQIYIRLPDDETNPNSPNSKWEETGDPDDTDAN